MTKRKPPPSAKPNMVAINPAEHEHGQMRDLGGAESDRWNQHLLGKLVAAFPNGLKPDRCNEIVNAVLGAQLGIKPADPVEAMLSSQLIAANTAALDLYRRAWIDEQSFEVRTRYLALADKAARTVAMLSEALDRHRGRGQQQITVKHVTVNAEQAVVTDQIVTTARALGGGGDGQQNTDQPHAKPALAHAPVAPLPCAVEADGAVLPVTGR